MDPPLGPIVPLPRSTDRCALLAGTALVSTLLLTSLFVPAPARAVTNCLIGNPPPGPIAAGGADSFVCVNVDNRSNAGNVISLFTSGSDHFIDLYNSGILHAYGAGNATDIRAATLGANSPIDIANVGDNVASSTGSIALGIIAGTTGAGSPISIANSGDFTVSSTGGLVWGFYASTRDGSPLSIVNSGDFVVNSTTSLAWGVYADTRDGSPISITNSGDFVVASAGNRAYGIEAGTLSSPLSIANSGDFTVTSTADRAYGIYAYMYGGHPLSVVNSGDLSVTSTAQAAYGISAYAGIGGSPTSIVNSGSLVVINSGGPAFSSAFGIRADIGNTSPLSIVNSGSIVATSVPGPSFGIFAATQNITSPIGITNSGSIFGGSEGIRTFTSSAVTIVNTGELSAGSLLAIHTTGSGPVQILNAGQITGFVQLGADNIFVNQKSGTFDARLDSNFGPGDSLFRNESGGTVHAVKVNGVQPFFMNLDRFENRGVVSTQNGRVGDVFTVTGAGFEFQGKSDSTLSVDAFLGPPGSTADNFVIDGNVSGRTALSISNTNPGPGVFNPQGIPVVFVNGNVNANNFFMPQPFDSGLFDWDVYFVPTGSGFFELRSFPGGGAHILPQLLTAAQDIFHMTNETWFDRTEDLRVLLNRGVPYGTDGTLGEGGISSALGPAVWVKGSAGWFEQDDVGTTRAYGRTYRYNLNRELDVADFEGGIDFGKKGVLAEGDALVFGILGGVVLGGLDYDKLIRQFNIEGGEAGAYATYLRGGLFVDTLVKADFLEFDTRGAPGLPGSLDATAWGFRTDAGYRFGQFRRGPFIEPLATIAVAWSEIDDFSLGGNSVKFSDEADVRGRLGLRVGTSREIIPAIVMEPFVIGSVWGHLSGENKATVNSLGTTFGPFTDAPDDVWGVVSTGINFFSPGTQSALFAKLDVTFGDEVEGFSAKGGMRYNW
jgi:hypothetical protein